MKGIRGTTLCWAVFLWICLPQFSAAATDTPMQFSDGYSGGNCEECGWIQATGVITADTPTRLRQALKKSGGGGRLRIVINSPGGNLQAGTQLGIVFREFQATVIVGRTIGKPGEQYIGPGVCASACAYALLGGINRSVEKGSRVGVHQFYDTRAMLANNVTAYTNKDIMGAQATVGMLALYTFAMGIDARFVFLASGTAPNDMRWLSDDELEQLGVVTAISKIGNVNLIPVGQGIVARTIYKYKQSPERLLSLYCKNSSPNWIFVRIDFNVLESVQRLNISSSSGLAHQIIDDPWIGSADSKDNFKLKLQSISFQLYRGGDASMEAAIPIAYLPNILSLKTAIVTANVNHAFGWEDGRSPISAEFHPAAHSSFIRAALRYCL
jgi:hypothetical protein